MLIKSQSELDEFLHELDEDVEGMQSTILLLQQELKTKNDFIQLLEKENENLRQNQNQQTNEQTDIKHDSTTETAKIEENETSSNGEHNVITPKIEIIEDDNNLNKNSMETDAKDNDNDNGNVGDTKDLNKCPDNNNLMTYNAINDISSLSGQNDASEVNVVNLNKIETSDMDATPYINGGAAENITTTMSSGESSEESSAQLAINSRKRTHDDNNANNENSVIQQQQSAYLLTPRMLPPKKSKLRVTPEEILEQQEDYVNVPVAEEALSLVMEKDPLASSHNDPLGASCDELNDATGIGGIGLAAQRILTRRRSMRQQTQPNGSINMTMVGGGANGNDSNDAATLN